MAIQMIDFELAVRREQFKAYFQPIVDLHSGEITAIEARVRWNRDVGQQLSAADVLKAAGKAEANGLLDVTMLEQSMASMDVLSASAAPALAVAVNISAATCTNAAMAGQLEKFLAEAGVKPERLRLEIPCEALCAAPDTVGPLIRRLAASGHTIVIDHVDSVNFRPPSPGDIPVHAIKLHEKIVTRAPEDKACAAQVRDICKEAQKQGLRVGVEGVVRVSQIKFLDSVGCHEGQGPLICRPHTLGLLMDLLKKRFCW